MSILRKLIHKTEQKRHQNVAGGFVVNSIHQILEKSPMELRFEQGKSQKAAIQNFFKLESKFTHYLSLISAKASKFSLQFLWMILLIRI